MNQGNSQDFKNLTYLRFVNEAQMTKSKLKIRSFYIFHKCQHHCLKDINNKQSDECFNRCQTEIDSYFEEKKAKKIESKVFHAIPQDQRQIEEAGWTPQQVIEAKNKILDYKNKTNNVLAFLKTKLDDMEKQFK